jgi:hypothetical protein
MAFRLQHAEPPLTSTTTVRIPWLGIGGNTAGWHRRVQRPDHTGNQPCGNRTARGQDAAVRTLDQPTARAMVVRIAGMCRLRTVTVGGRVPEAAAAGRLTSTRDRYTEGIYRSDLIDPLRRSKN